MLARDLISDSIPPVKLTDPASRVMDWLNQFTTHQLPIVEREKLLGLISEDELLDVEDETIQVVELRFIQPDNIFVYEDSHAYDVIRKMGSYNLSIVPVLNPRDNTYLGLVTWQDIVDYMARSLNATEPGGIIVLDIAQNGYSISEIGRICESNDAKILSLTVSQGTDLTRLKVTIKLNIRELSRVLSTFERFDYIIDSVVFDAEQLDDFRERYENLLRYLDS